MIVASILLAIVLGLQIAIVIVAACNAVAIGHLEEELDEIHREKE